MTAVTTLVLGNDRLIWGRLEMFSCTYLGVWFLRLIMLGMVWTREVGMGDARTLCNWLQ